MNADQHEPQSSEMELNDDDAEEIIDLEGSQGIDDELAQDMCDVELENEDAMEGMSDGASAVRDDADVVFEKHSGAVFCVCIDPRTSQLVASGGEDDKAYVWRASDGEVLLECTGHKDSVTCIAFCHDSSLLATGDMSGLVKVWNMETRQEVWSFEVSDLEWLEWHHSAPVILAGTADGDVWMWKIPSGDCKTFQGHGRACGTGTILPDGKRACTGYEDGTVKVWDLKAGTPVCTLNSCHADTVTCLACHHDNVIVATGSTDGMAKLMNTVSGKVIATFDYSASEGSDKNSIEALGFCKTRNLLAIGTLDGNVGLWDVSTHKMRHQCKHEAGVVRLWWDAVAPFLYVCTLDGVVHLWDGRTGERVAQWFGHTDGILDFKISRDGCFLATASEDKTVRMFTLQSLDR